MTQIIFDIERCFVDGRSGPIELGVTRLDDLAQAQSPLFDVRDREHGSPSICYGDDHRRIEFFDLNRNGLVTGIHVDLSGHRILESRLRFPHWDNAELDCGPFRIRMNGEPVDHWATLVDALASEAIEPTRPIALSSDPRSDLRILNVDWRRDDRWLHLAFEPRLTADPNHHAWQVWFEYCAERLRLFDYRFAPKRGPRSRASGFGPGHLSIVPVGSAGPVPPQGNRASAHQNASTSRPSSSAR